MKNNYRLSFGRILLLGLFVFHPSISSSHPLGNFSVNHYSRVEVQPGGVLAQTVLDFAEIPSFNELAAVDTNADNIVSKEEKQAYLDSFEERFLSSMTLTLSKNGDAIDLQPKITGRNILLSLGQAGLTCLQVQLVCEIPFPKGLGEGPFDFTFEDKIVTHIKGMREIRLVLGESILAEKKDIHNTNQNPVVELNDRYYGMEGLSVQVHFQKPAGDTAFDPQPAALDKFVDVGSMPEFPLEERADGSYSVVKSPIQPNREVQAKVAMLQPRNVLGASQELFSKAATQNLSQPEEEPPQEEESGYAEKPESKLGNNRLTAKGDQEWSNLIGASDLNAWFVISAIFLSIFYGMVHALSPGHGKTIVAAYLIGSRGTIFHAIYLGIIVTLTHVSSVLLIGLITLYFLESVVHNTLYAYIEVSSGFLIVLIGFAQFFRRFGALQQMKAVETIGTVEHPHDHHHHDHSHDHNHDHDHNHEHALAHGHDRDHVHTHEHHDHSHDHTHDHDHHHHGWLGDHEHGPHTHTHDIPAEASWWELLVLGITGGIVPCPAAILVLLVAIATKKLIFGMTLILFFSMGLAAVLITIGVLMVTAKKLFDRFQDTGKAVMWLQVISPVLITLLGVVIIIRGLITGGIISINL